MATQVETSRNGIINAPSTNREEGLVKTLVRGLVRSGGIYANARMAADQESDAEKKQVHERAAEKAKSALLEDIAAANEYIDTLKQKIAAAKNESTANPNEAREESAQTTISEQDEEIGIDETDEIIDPTVEEDTPESESESVSVLEEVGTEGEESIEDIAAQTAETEVDEAAVVAEMFGLAKATADVISELLFSGSRNAIEPNQRLTRRTLEKIALILDAIDIDETEVRDRTRAFLLHKGFDADEIIEETVEAVLTLWQQYQE